jgi:ribonuclease HI/exonuclease III
MNRDTTKLRIIQYNVHRQYGVMAEMLRRPGIENVDIIAVQEPWISPHNGNTHNSTKNLFHTILPDTEERPRVCFYINRGMDISKLRIHQHASRDIISALFDTETPIAIHNIYNPHTDGSAPNAQYYGIPGNSVIPTLDQALYTYRSHEQIAVGDFNLQHHDWTGQLERNSHNNQTTCLKETFQRAGMEQCVPIGTITRPPDRSYNEGTTIDLVWATEGIRTAMTSCGVQHDMDCDSDHLPIETSLNISTPQRPEERRRNYAAMDLPKLRKGTEQGIPRHLPMRTQAQLDTYTESISTAIVTAIDMATPQIRIHNTYTRREFNRETATAIRKVRKARRKWQARQDDESREEYREANQQKARAIARSNRDDHRERVAEVDSLRALWKLARWVKNKDSIKPIFTPNIKYRGRTLQGWKEKAEAFAETFFPPPPEADLSDIQNYEYPQPVPCPEITEEEVLEAIRLTSGDKAPGPDQTPNKVLKAIADIISGPLQGLFNACLRVQHCPQHFKHSTTVVIPKPGKPSYKETKAYRPIALMNTIGKIFDSILARRLQYYAEQYHLLPRNHTGGRKATSSEHALHMLIEKVHAAWAEGEVASLLLLDVTGAFDNVSHERLTHNLRKRHIHPDITGWIGSYLRNRTTEIRLSEGTTEPIPANTGIPQGSPLSPILYLFYNADLLDIGGPEDLVTGYIDDTSILVTGSTKEGNVEQLRAIHEKAAEWARQTGSVFAPQKYELIHFAKGIKDQEVEAPLDLPTAKVWPAKTAKLLGVILDKELVGLPHAEHLRRKADTSIRGMKAIAGSTWGINLQQGMQLYKATILPKITYASSTWFRSNPEHGQKGATAKTLAILQSIQKDALRIATGAWKNTALAAMEIETNTTPIDLYLQQRNENALHRIRGSPVYNTIKSNRATQDKRKWRRKPPLQSLEELHITSNRITGQPQEEIEPMYTNTASPWWEPPETHTASTKEAAIRLHRARTRRMGKRATHALIYTDGSEIQNQVGAAAWCPSAGRKKMRYLGDNTKSTVYSAELVGLELALQITQELDNCNGVTIFTDNQAAIQAVTRPSISSGQYITHKVIQEIERARRKGINVTIQWTPSHKGIPGNEEVDLLAKKAAGWDSDTGKVKPDLRAPAYPIYTLRSAKKRTARENMRGKWAERWHIHPHGRMYYPYAPTPHKAYLAAHSGRGKALSAVTIQMRTGKIGLYSYLHGIRPDKITTDRCRGCNRHRETLQHVLLDCPSYREARQKYWPERTPYTLQEILTDAQETATAAKLILSTNLLHQFSRVKKGTPAASVRMPSQN